MRVAPTAVEEAVDEDDDEDADEDASALAPHLAWHDRLTGEPAAADKWRRGARADLAARGGSFRHRSCRIDRSGPPARWRRALVSSIRQVLDSVVGAALVCVGHRGGALRRRQDRDRHRDPGYFLRQLPGALQQRHFARRRIARRDRYAEGRAAAWQPDRICCIAQREQAAAAAAPCTCAAGWSSPGLHARRRQALHYLRCRRRAAVPKARYLLGRGALNRPTR